MNEWIIQWLTQYVLVLLLDESAFLNESLAWFKDKYILTAPFCQLNVIDTSSFEVPNYFQKVINSIRVYIWTINFYPSTFWFEKTVKLFHLWQISCSL